MGVYTAAFLGPAHLNPAVTIALPPSVNFLGHGCCRLSQPKCWCLLRSRRCLAALLSTLGEDQ